MREHLLPDFVNKVCEGEQFEIFVDEVVSLLPKSVRKHLVFDSLRHLAGEKLTRKVLDDNCWRLAGNLDTLKRDKPAGVWSYQADPEWVPAQIMSTCRRRGGRGNRQLGWYFAFQILAGRSCSLRIQQFWSQKFCSYIAADLGFRMFPPSERSGRPAERLYRNPTEFVTLRLALLIEPELSREVPGFKKTDITGQLKDWNIDQLKCRDRVQPGYTCPRGYSPAIKCFQCAAGYSSCRAGTHRADYTLEYCPECSTDNAPFDADISDSMCVNCYDARAIQRS
jgi:hypothetical protein